MLPDVSRPFGTLNIGRFGVGVTHAGVHGEVENSASGVFGEGGSTPRIPAPSINWKLEIGNRQLSDVLQQGGGLLLVAGALGCAGDAEAGAHEDMMGRCFHGILQ